MRHLVIFLSYIILLAGCATPHTISEDAINANLAVEEAQNKMLLLNIIRSSKGHPLHFTRINNYKGTFTTTYTLGGLTIPFGGDAASTYQIVPNITHSRQPIYDVSVLDSQDFYNGILSPVDIKIIEYFFSQGYQRDYLFYLFIRTVEIGEECYLNTRKNIKEVRDCPDNFDNLVRGFYPGDNETSQIRIENEPPDALPTTVTDANTVKNLLKLKEKGLHAEKIANTNEYEIRPNAATLAFVYGKDDKKLQLSAEREADTSLKMQIKHLEENIEKIKNEIPKVIEKDKIELQEQLDKQKEELNKKKKISRAFIRSTEAIIYYLGSIFSNQNTPLLYNWENREYDIPLFVLKTGNPALNGDESILDVVYQGETYYIPKEKNGRSMHVLWILTQLMALHLKAVETPTTGTATIIGVP